MANYGDVVDRGTTRPTSCSRRSTPSAALDIVVNNAGILRDASIAKMTEEDWDSVIRVHLKGTFNMTHHACAYWQSESKEGRQRRAAIVNTVRSAGLQGNIGQANYGAAKAGIAALTVITALEGKRYGVRANAIAPGGATRMVNEAMPQHPGREADEVGRRRVRAPEPGQLGADGRVAGVGRGTARVGPGVPRGRRRDHPLPAVAHRPLGRNAVKGDRAEVGPGPDRRRGGQGLFGLQPGGLKLGR